jgi:hypothetical protein
MEIETTFSNIQQVEFVRTKVGDQRHYIKGIGQNR